MTLMTVWAPQEIADLVARIPEGFTEGPWWTDASYDGREMGCAVIAARTDAGPLPGNPTRGMVGYASAVLNTEARRCEANARLIALAPELAAALRAQQEEIGRLRRAAIQVRARCQGMRLDPDASAALDALDAALSQQEPKP